MDNRVIILDTTLRDGEQTPGVNLNLTEKLEIARQLEKLGVDIIEAGFPASSKSDLKAVKAVAKAVNCSVAGLARCVEKDILDCWEAVRENANPRINLVLATSKIHMESKLKMTEEEVLKRAKESVKLAKSFAPNVEFICEDATRSEPKFLYRVLEAVIANGAGTVTIADTVGYELTEDYSRLIENILQNVKNINQAVISVHCHNDLGMAVANSMAAIRHGARQVEVTVNGIGERAGNCPLEEIVMAMTTREKHLSLTHNIDTKRLSRTSQMVANLTGVPVGVCKAVVGKNVFSHASGIHQHGMLSNPLTYEIMTPESVGKKESTLVLDKHSGRHAFLAHLNQLGFQLGEEEIEDTFAKFKALAEKQKEITDDDLERLIDIKAASIPEQYKLVDFETRSSSKTGFSSTITLSENSNILIGTAKGEGSVDAPYQALMEAIGENFRLATYSTNEVTRGEDALVEVTVRIEKENQLYKGKGISPDIIEASIRGYINAVNRYKTEQNGELNED